eukprot:gene2292-2602_t
MGKYAQLVIGPAGCGKDNLEEWLSEELEGYGDDDYLVFDCPGQIELYSHVNAIRSLVDWLRAEGWTVAAVFCMDVAFVNEPTKYIAGAMQALAAMVKLELPHINLLTKMDLAEDKQAVEALVGFVPLDISDEDSIGEVLLQIDMAIQYGEDADVKVREFEEEDMDVAEEHTGGVGLD